MYIDGAFDVFHPGHVKILKVWGKCGAGVGQVDTQGVGQVWGKIIKVWGKYGAGVGQDTRGVGLSERPPDLGDVCVCGGGALPHPSIPASPLPLQAAKAEGDFLLVGLHTDEDVTERRGPHLPIMNLHERRCAGGGGVLGLMHASAGVMGGTEAGCQWAAPHHLVLSL